MSYSKMTRLDEQEVIKKEQKEASEELREEPDAGEQQGSEQEATGS